MNDNDEKAQFWDRVKDVRVAMLTTISGDGSLESRPMFTQEGDQQDGLWFITARSSEKAHDLEREHEVNLSYADPQKQLYVSVSGRARIVDDKGKVHEYWNPMNEAFFPEGPDDPEVVLLHVDPVKAEYWDAPSGRMRQLFGLARSLFRGKRYEQGENEKVDLD